MRMCDKDRLQAVPVGQTLQQSGEMIRIIRARINNDALFITNDVSVGAAASHRRGVGRTHLKQLVVKSGDHLEARDMSEVDLSQSLLPLHLRGQAD